MRDSACNQTARLPQYWSNQPTDCLDKPVIQVKCVGVTSASHNLQHLFFFFSFWLLHRLWGCCSALLYGSQFKLGEAVKCAQTKLLNTMTGRRLRAYALGICSSRLCPSEHHVSNLLTLPVNNGPSWPAISLLLVITCIIFKSPFVLVFYPSLLRWPTFPHGDY